MKKALMIASVLLIAVISTACINNIAVQELNNKAAEYMQKGDYDSAMNRLQASLDLDATMYETHYNLGVAAINAKKYDKAIEALENGIKIKPDFADFYYSLGIAQSSFADDLLEPNDAQDENNEQEQLTTEENKTKAVELKKQALENLKKYLEMAPAAENEATTKELVVEINNFLNGENKEETAAE